MVGNNWRSVVERAGIGRRLEVITFTLLHVPALSNKHHQLLPNRAGDVPYNHAPETTTITRATAVLQISDGGPDSPFVFECEFSRLSEINVHFRV